MNTCNIIAMLVVEAGQAQLSISSSVILACDLNFGHSYSLDQWEICRLSGLVRDTPPHRKGVRGVSHMFLSFLRAVCPLSWAREPCWEEIPKNGKTGNGEKLHKTTDWGILAATFWSNSSLFLGGSDLADCKNRNFVIFPLFEGTSSQQGSRALQDQRQPAFHTEPDVRTSTSGNPMAHNRHWQPQVKLGASSHDFHQILGVPAFPHTCSMDSS